MIARIERPGQAPGAVLLSHATGMCKETWEPFAHELAVAGCRRPVVAWDYGSHGESDKLPHPIDWWDFGRQALEVAKSVDGPRIGVGHSMGGAALAMAAVLAPGTFDRLVLVDPIILPGPYRRNPDGPMSVVARKRRAAYDSRAEAIANFAEKAVFARWQVRALEAYTRGGLVETAGGRWALRCTPDDEAETFAGAGAHGLFERLGEITVPLTLVTGEYSNTHTAELAELQCSAWGGPAEWVRFDDATHFVPMEQPERLARLVAGISGFETGSID